MIGLVVFPVGTLLGAYLLYLLASDPGRRLLSPEHLSLVAATPQIRTGSTWLSFGLVILQLAAMIAAAAKLGAR